MLLVSKLIFGSGNSTWSNSDARGASSRMSSNSIIGRTSTWIPSSFKISRASAHKLCMAGSGDTNSWRTWVFLIRCAIEIGELRIDSGNARRPRRMVPTIVEKKLMVSVVKDDYTECFEQSYGDVTHRHLQGCLQWGDAEGLHDLDGYIAHRIARCDCELSWMPA